MARSIGPRLRYYWRTVSDRPGGKWLFSRVLGLIAPYTGSLGGTIQLLEPGHCVVTLPDRRRIRNHLNSVHAIALCNLGEKTTGLALMHSLPENTRGILTGISADYVKKARGLLTAECYCDIPDGNEKCEHTVKSDIRDAEGELVATVCARWLIGPETHAD
jgi:acyl-coenzyme A thioesterase PaaI-like protein